MKPIYEMKLIQIEITNACPNRCANCTRFVGHHKDPFYMDLATVEKALDSLEGYPGQIGIMGGEPTLHPQFREICKLVQKKVTDRTRRELWTAGYKWKEYKDVIDETFDRERIAYNDHSSPDGRHHPLLIAAEDVMDDKELMWKLIDDCWVQKRWSASITTKGAFFCEVAAAQDHLFKGPGGYPIERGWWNKTPKDFADQVKRYCPRCSAALPVPSMSDHEKFDLISQGNADRLKAVNSPKFLAGNIKIFDKKITAADVEAFKAEETRKRELEPQNYRTFVAHGPEDYENYKKQVGKKSPC